MNKKEEIKKKREKKYCLLKGGLKRKRKRELIYTTMEVSSIKMRCLFSRAGQASSKV